MNVLIVKEEDLGFKIETLEPDEQHGSDDDHCAPGLPDLEEKPVKSVPDPTMHVIVKEEDLGIKIETLEPDEQHCSDDAHFVPGLPDLEEKPVKSGASTPMRPKLDYILPIAASQDNNTKSEIAIATITNPEQKSGEDISLNTKNNVELDNNKGKEHILQKNKSDITQKMVFTNMAEQKPAWTKSDDKTFSATKNQQNSSNICSSFNRVGAILTCDFSEYYTFSQDATKQYICNSCSYFTTRLSNLRRHVKGHTDEKPYSCSVCDKKFTLKAHLDSHLRVHTGEKPYSCNVCDKKFSHQCSLHRHVRIHTGDKPYSCNLCDKKFSQHVSLDAHIRVHTGEKPYSCNVCDKKFSHKKSLHTHVRVHTGDKPHSCNVCHKNFSQKAHLDSHVRVHSGIDK